MVIKCDRCNKEFMRKGHLDRHLNKKSKCVDINKLLEKEKEQYNITIYQYEQKIKEYETKLEDYQKLLEQKNNMFYKLLDEKSGLIDILLDSTVINNHTTNIDNRIINNTSYINVNQTVAFGEETSDHIPMNELLEITGMGHPKGTLKLIERIYGHENNKGTIVIKNKRKGIFNVSDGKGGFIEKDRESIKATIALRLAIESHRALVYIGDKEAENKRMGIFNKELLDMHYNTNMILIEMNNLKKTFGNKLLKIVIDL